MKDDIKLIEQRIETVVGRLKELTAERDTARGEAASLREELRSLQDGLAEDDEDSTLRERRDEAVALIRDTLGELREDGAR